MERQNGYRLKVHLSFKSFQNKNGAMPNWHYTSRTQKIVKTAVTETGHSVTVTQLNLQTEH